MRYGLYVNKFKRIWQSDNIEDLYQMMAVITEVAELLGWYTSDHGVGHWTLTKSRVARPNEERHYDIEEE